MSSDSILVSWKPPVEPNGIVEQYTVYVKENGVADSEDTNPDATPKSQKIVPNIKNQNLSFQSKNLDNKLKYEFWVTASTNIGEGQPSKSVVIAPSTRGRPQIPKKGTFRSMFFFSSSKDSVI